MPIYDTLLTAILIPALKVDSPAMLFNRKHVDLIALKSNRVDEPWVLDKGTENAWPLQKWVIEYSPLDKKECPHRLVD